ncbi:MAG: hypothetical protein P1V20_13235 [Verrucomicrobiales bacterium]|nr:hypothetical protein [Verrucomicrobiales bacterium]
MNASRGIYLQGDSRIIRCDDPESNGVLYTIPFSGDFDISAKINVKQLPEARLEAGFICIWKQGKVRHSILRTARGNVRVRDDYAPGDDKVLQSISPALLEKHPWIRVRKFSEQVTVFVSHDSKFWKERVRFPAPSENGRIGVALFGDPELGARSAVFDDLSFTVVSTKKELITLDDRNRNREKPAGQPSALPDKNRIKPGMLLEKWFFPPTIHTIGAFPHLHPSFPEGAEETRVVNSLAEAGFAGKSAGFRMVTDFAVTQGGFYEFQLEGIRNGQITIQELHPIPDKPAPHQKKIILAVDAAQRFGSGSFYLKKDRFYRLDLLALHRDDASLPLLTWVKPGSEKHSSFAPDKYFLPAVDPLDIDRDGLPDQWELTGIGTLDSKAFDDPDRDRLPNILEWKSGSDPSSPDSDGDKISDLIEEATGAGVISSEIVPLREAPEKWEFAWLPPEMKPLGKEEFLSKPKSFPVLQLDPAHHYLLATRNTYRGNRVGWTPFLYRELKGDFDVMTLVDFPSLSKQMPLLRSAAGGLMARQAVGGNSRFELSFCVSNTGELMIKHIPEPSSGLKPNYENQYGGDTAWKEQKLWVRLIRRGKKMVCAWSPDREVWIQTSDPLTAVDGPVYVGTYALGGAMVGELGVRFRNPEFFDPGNFAHPVYDKHIKRWNDLDSDKDGLPEKEESEMGLTKAGLDKSAVELEFTSEIEVNQSHVTSGKWVSAGARGIYCQDGRGDLSVNISIPEPGLYRAVVETAPALNYGGSGNPIHEMQVTLDEKHLPVLTVSPRPNGMSKFPVVLPFLAKGTHVLSFSYFSPRAARSLPVKRVVIEKIVMTEPSSEPEPKKGFFSFFKKRKPVVKADLNRQLLENRNPLPAGEIQSSISPAFVEGQSLFPGWIAVKTTDEIPVHIGVNNGWFTNVPLKNTDTTTVTLEAENGGNSSQLSIRWTPTDILQGGNIILRKGDALKLVAGQSKNQYQITVGDRLLGEGRTDPYIYQFDKPGTFEVVAESKSDEPARSVLTVEVLNPVFSANPVALTGRRRTWTNPALDLKHLTLESDAELAVSPLAEDPPESKRLALSGGRTGLWKVQARLPSGAIAAQAEVKVISLFHATETAIDRVNLGANGRMMSLQWAVPDAPDSLKLQVRLIAGTGLFTDGSIVQTLTPNDLDSTGRMGVNALQPPGEGRALCHHVYVFDGDHYIGSL